MSLCLVRIVSLPGAMTAGSKDSVPSWLWSEIPVTLLVVVMFTWALSGRVFATEPQAATASPRVGA
jgi:hypothetical protein